MEIEKASKRDIWDKANIFIKAFGIIFVSGAITFYGIYSENKRGDTQLKVAEENNRSRLYAQAMNSRQTARVEVLKELLNIVMKDYLTADDMNRKLLKLNLLALNFQEQLHLKPLFLDLENEFELAEDPRRHEQLRRIASQLKMGQINRLVADGASEYRFSLRPNEEERIAGNNNHASVDLVLTELHDDGIRVEARIGEIVWSFRVGYYDLPFLDNFPIEDRRYALVLNSINLEHSVASVSVVIYPRDYFDIQDRIRVDRLLGR